MLCGYNSCIANKQGNEMHASWKQSVVNRFERQVEDADAATAKFTAQVTADPVDALNWATPYFAQAARRVTALMVLNCIKEGFDLELTTAYMRERVLNRAKNPVFSTSPTSNLVYQFETSSAAEAYDYLDLLGTN
jgi:hypothetical protein